MHVSLSLSQIREAQTVVYRHMPPTPQYSLLLINQRLSTEQKPVVDAWIKHDMACPLGHSSCAARWSIWIG